MHPAEEAGICSADLNSMEKNDQYYQGLLDKYVSNACSPEEAAELFRYFGEAGANRLLLKQLQQQFNQSLLYPYPDMPEEQRQRMEERLLRQINPAKPIPLYRNKWWQMAAAVALLVICGSIYLWHSHPAAQAPAITTAQPIVANPQVVPGTNKAVLTLSDGSTVALDSTGNSMLAMQGSARIRQQGGSLVYDVAGANTSPAYNTIHTPRGGQYKLVLSDGSRVWLNAASSLRFPAAFAKGERVVQLNGEAYFEINEDAKRPFRVELNNNQSIMVLGTHFNVMAYDDEQAVRTTLLAGKVKVTRDHFSELLQPGQQATLNKHKPGIDIAGHVNLEEVMAWKNGMFQFEGNDIHTVMRQISRWYNTNVVFAPRVNENAHFWGAISRNADISEVLQVLEMTEEVHFKIENGIINVLP